MLSKKIIFVVSFVLIFLGNMAICSGFYDSSKHWPPYVELKSDYESEGVTLRAERRAVLIRLIDEETALIDFGRRGIHQIPVGLTNFEDRFLALTDGQETKRLPNLIELIGPRMLREVDGELKSLKFFATDSSEVSRFAGVFFIYLPDEIAAGDLSSEYRDILGLAFANEIGVLFMPQYPIAHEDLMHRLIAQNLTGFYVLYDFVNKGYVHSLMHEPSDNVVHVLSDPDGKIIWRGDALNLDYLNQSFTDLGNEIKPFSE